MSLKFDEALEIVVEKLLETPKPKYQTYLRDATEISAKIDQELIKINSIFKGTVSNWDETIDLYKTEVPKLQIPLLRLKMPFAVEPQQVLVFSNDQKVNLKTSVNHPAVENGYLNGEKLTQLFIWDLNRVIDKISKITCSSGKIYELCFEVNEVLNSLVISIRAMETGLQDFPSIMYYFLLSFKFTNKSSYFLYALHFFHQSKEPSAEANLMKNMKVVHSVKVLILTLANKSTSKISPFALHNIINYMNIGPASEIGSLLLHAIQRCLPFVQNPGPLISAYGKLLQLKQSNSVPLSDLKEMFGLK